MCLKNFKSWKQFSHCGAYLALRKLSTPLWSPLVCQLLGPVFTDTVMWGWERNSCDDGRTMWSLNWLAGPERARRGRDPHGCCYIPSEAHSSEKVMWTLLSATRGDSFLRQPWPYYLLIPPQSCKGLAVEVDRQGNKYILGCKVSHRKRQR